jgi:hypothetical protein
MTERKPQGATTGSWVDQQIRDAQERGEFADLPGAGKPIPDLARPWDAGQWAREYARREGLSARAMLPPSLAMRAEHDDLPSVLVTMRTEKQVRDHVLDFNRRLREAKLAHLGGPPFLITTLDVDQVVADWRTERTRRETARAVAAAARLEDSAGSEHSAGSGLLRRWFRRPVR